MDIVLFRLINNLAEKSATLDLIGVFFASGVLWLMFFLLLFLFAWRPTRREQIHEFATLAIAGFASLFAYVTNFLVSLVYFRVRPFAALSGVHQLIVKEVIDKGFPSDHAALAFAVAVAVCLAHRKWGIVFLILAALVALGRVFVGVHYPFDVLAGAIVGSGFAFLVNHFGRKIFESFFKKYETKN